VDAVLAGWYGCGLVECADVISRGGAGGYGTGWVHVFLCAALALAGHVCAGCVLCACGMCVVGAELMVLTDRGCVGGERSETKRGANGAKQNAERSETRSERSEAKRGANGAKQNAERTERSKTRSERSDSKRGANGAKQNAE